MVGQTQEYDNGNSGEAKTISWNNGRHQKIVIDDDCVLSFIDPQFVGRYDLRIIQTGSGNSTISFPSNVVFEGNEPVWSDMLSGEEVIMTVRFNGDGYLASVTAIYEPGGEE